MSPHHPTIKLALKLTGPRTRPTTSSEQQLHPVQANNASPPPALRTAKPRFPHHGVQNTAYRHARSHPSPDHERGYSNTLIPDLSSFARRRCCFAEETYWSFPGIVSAIFHIVTAIYTGEGQGAGGHDSSIELRARRKSWSGNGYY